MKRPTIADLARAADVSISTVDRVLNGRDPVRRDKAERVMASAEAIGFRATGLLRHRLGGPRPSRTFGFLLQQQEDPFYAGLGAALVKATGACPLVRGEAQVTFATDFDPADRGDMLLDMGRRVDAVAVVAAVHPRVGEAIATLRKRGVPVLALVSDLPAPDKAGYAGIDNRKAGRTAGWAIAQACQTPGEVGILIGTHRFLCQDTSEAACRAFLRERTPHLGVLQPLASFEEPRYAYENTLDLLTRHPDLRGLYITGGGTAGALQALTDAGRSPPVFTVAREVTPVTRAGLAAGVLSLVLSHPVDRLAALSVAALARAVTGASPAPPQQVIVPFDVVTPENL